MAVLQVLAADRLEIGDGLHRIGRAAHDIQAQHHDHGGCRVAFPALGLPWPHFAAPFPLLRACGLAGSALRRLRSSFSRSVEETLRTSSCPEYRASSARWRSRSACSDLIWAPVSASAASSSRRLWSKSARWRVLRALSSASFSQRSVPISTSPPVL